MISSSLNLRRIYFPSVKCDLGQKIPGNAVTRPLQPLRLHNWCVASLSTNSNNSPSFDPSSASPTTFISSVGYPTSSLTQPLAWNLNQRHVIVLNVIACVAAISATLFFCAAIPTLLAFKRAAESLEKLLDVTREELPDTMAAVRLSGMEMSDLTMELSDLGHGITQGVKRSTRAVHLAKERLRQFTSMNPSELMQVVVQMKPEPAVGKAARGLRESIVNSRAFVQMFFSITRFSKLAFNYLMARANSKS